MNNLKVLSKENASQETKDILAGLEEKIGMIPNVYAAIGNSSKALSGLLAFNQTLSKGEFSGKEVEAIALAVATENTCNYCLSAHTASGKMQGFSEEETIAIRNGDVADEKLKVLTDLAKSITSSRGRPEQNLIDGFYNVGYTQAAMSELIALVAVNTITNYTNHIAETEIDFPVAPQLEEEMT